MFNLELVKVDHISHMSLILKVGHFKNGLGQTVTLKLWKTDLISNLEYYSFYAFDSCDLFTAQ